MTETLTPDLPQKESTPAPLNRTDWLAMMDRVGEDAGHFQPLGARHWAFFVDESPTLVVTFETLESIRARAGQMPMGHEIAAAKGWSHLCIIADGDTWYRDARVYGYFDRLVDDAFFEDFDRVVFMGTDAQAYAAAAFSVVAPGGSVLAINPRATMAPAMAGWDKRAPAARRYDFTSRYGYAPDMVEGAGQVIVIHDPEATMDAMHAALFRGAHILHLHAPRLEGRVHWALSQMNLYPALVEQALEGTLTRASWGRLWRARRDFGPYLRLMLTRANAAGRVGHERAICRSVTSRLQGPRFRKRLAEILAAEAAAATDRTRADTQNGTQV